MKENSLTVKITEDLGKKQRNKTFFKKSHSEKAFLQNQVNQVKGIHILCH